MGKAQEKTPVIRTEKRINERTGRAYPWLVRSTAMVNHWYWYAVDQDFGPFFLKVCTYFPYTVKVCLNGHEYLKRQLAQMYDRRRCGQPRESAGAPHVQSRISGRSSPCLRMYCVCSSSFCWNCSFT